MFSGLLLAQGTLDGIATGAIVALVALGLSLVFRIGRFVNVGHVDTATAGAYVTLSAAASGLPFLAAACVGTAVAALTGWGAWALVYRRMEGARPIALIIASIGVGLILRYGVIFIWGTQQFGFDVPLLRAWRFWGLRITPYDLATILLTIGLFVTLALVLRFTAFGRELRAVADSLDLARVAGIRPRLVLGILWLIGAALAGIGGILLGIKTVVMPYLGFQLLVPAFAAMILGGVGSLAGTLIGAIVIGIVSEFAALFWQPTYRLAASFAVILITLALRPQGLFGMARAAR